MVQVKPKIYALYLPQFYETEYNSTWWGDGYTDWVATRQAKRLFQGHNQPRVPLSENYYDLSVVDNIRWQAEQAKIFGIDGFAIYQYYSCGQKLLEIPAELIRDTPDIELDFYLYWANESWRKTWFGQDEEVIWRQQYGNEDSWRAHYEYCSLFFKDKRYFKIDGAPVYAIYKALDVPRIEDMIERWNCWAREDGFTGVYFVKTLGTKESARLGPFNGMVRREPNYTLAHDETIEERFVRYARTVFLSRVNKYFLMPFGTGILMLTASYDKIWRKILARPIAGRATFLGAFVDWDSSPRKQYNSLVMKGVTIEKFRRFFGDLYRKAVESQTPVIVINAWNEWGEGAYLEPDQNSKYGYLEAIKEIIDEN